MSLKVLLGLQIRRLRKKRGLSQEKFAEGIGKSREYVSNIERGVHWSSLEAIEQMAEFLHIPVKEIFDFPEIGQEEEHC